MPTRFSHIIAVIAFSTLAATATPAQTYKIINLGALPGYEDSYAMDLNDFGQVAGYVEDMAQDFTKSFVTGPPYDELTPLGSYVGAVQSETRAINNNSIVVGFTFIPNVRTFACVWNDGFVTTLTDENGNNMGVLYDINDEQQILGRSTDSGAGLMTNGEIQVLPFPPGLGSSYALAVNNSGVVAGAVADFSLNYSASKWVSGVHEYVPDLGGDYSQATDIADNGLVVGFSRLESSFVTHAFMQQGAGDAVDLGTLGNNSWAYGTNGTDVVGRSATAMGDRAFIYQSGAMTDLNSLIDGGLGWTLQSAEAINKHGQICGYGEFMGNVRAFLLTPVAMPAGIPNWDFTESDNGWTAVTNLPPFEPAEAQWVPGIGYGIRATGFPSFGFLQSPEVPLQVGQSYKVLVTLATTTLTIDAAPQCRLRAFQTDNSVGTFLALDSVNDVLPHSDAYDYEFTFTPIDSGTPPVFRFYLDFTHFNPLDDQSAWIYLESMSIAGE